MPDGSKSGIEIFTWQMPGKILGSESEHSKEFMTAVKA